jgi:hypothetical protein
MFMEGTHKLVTDQGETALLESDTVVLDDYVDAKVRLTGAARSTTEGNAIIVNVDGIERVLTDEEPSVLEESSSSSQESSSSEAASSSMSSVAVSSAAPASSKPASSAAPVVSSAAPVVASSSTAPVAVSSSSVAADDTGEQPAAGTMTANVDAMAKAKVDSANFTQQYCTTHIGFCIPVHRNWFFVSFGANVSPFLWHVELSDKEIESAGQGGISVNLVSGALTQPEGAAVSAGADVIAYRQWTGSRHFEVRGPAALKAAIEYIAQNIVTAGE